MKKTRIVLVGALVLALAFVMGCKQNEDLSVEEHRQDGHAQHIWEAEYSGNKYIRSALQFKEDNSVGTAKVTVEMTYPANGKAGVLFAVQEKDGKYDFYAFAFGWNGRTGSTSKLEAYVDYYQGLTTFNEASGDSEKFGNGYNTSVVVSKDLENTTWDGAEHFSADLYVTYDKGAGNYDLKLTKVGDENTVYWTANDVDAKQTLTSSAKPGMSAALVKNGEGKLYSYGMLSGQKETKKVKTTWTLDTKATQSAE